MKKMRKFLYSLILVTCIFMQSLALNPIYAASFSASASNNGDGTVTVYISGDLTGRFSVTVGNATTSIWVEQTGAAKLTTGAGTFNVLVVADASSTDGTIVNGVYIPIDRTIEYSTTVTVTVPNSGGSAGGSGGTPPNVSTPSTPPVENNTTTTTTTNNEETEKSTNNLLSSLTVDKGELSPTFDPNITDYTVELDYDVDTINIEAACQDLTASIIEGLGVHELNEGDNGIVVGVRAEDGSVRNYTINAKVAEAPKVTIKYNNEDYTIVSKYKDVTIPETFEETTLKINEQEVKALKSEKYQLTLLYLNKGEENKFYLYDEESSEVLGEFRTLSFNGKIYVVYPIDAKMQNQDHMIFTKVKIGEEEYDGWIYEDEKQKDFYVVYLVNDLGEKAFYRYDSVENSLQRLGSEIIPVEEETENNNYIYYIVVGIGVLVIAAIGYGVYYSTKKKRYQNRKKLQTEEHYFEVDDGDEN